MIYQPLDPIQRAERRKQVTAKAAKRWRQANRAHIAAYKRKRRAEKRA